MGQPWQELTLDELLDRFAAGGATPGGGAGAALTGALGAALVCMVCNLTIGRKKYAEVQSRLESVREESGWLRTVLLGLASRDSAAFESVMSAYRLPKDTQQQRANRREKIQEGLAQATEVPLEVMRTALRVMELGAEVAEEGNANALSDAAAAVHLAWAALQVGQFNVMINLPGIGDKPYIEKSKVEAEKLERLGSTVLERVNQLFRSRVAD